MLRWAVGGVALAALLALALWWPRASVVEPDERTRAELELRDGVLFLPASEIPFSGLLVEKYTGDRPKLAIGIHLGRAHGLSRGWYENGQLEVEETFVRGVSHGRRTRWHANGAKKSQAEIVEGVITGWFTQWHENGTRAAAVPLLDGEPHGLAEAWHPSGALKSRVVFDRGEPAAQEFFPDGPPLAQTAPNPSF